MIQNRNQNHLLCAIVLDHKVYLEHKFLIFKIKKRPHFFEVRGCFLSYVTPQGICNKFIEIGVIAYVATLNICKILMRLQIIKLNIPEI